MPARSLTVTDNRTGRTYELPVADGTIRAMDLRQIKEYPDDFGLMAYDPGYMNTACCRSTITYIDGDKGILLYRGYPIEQLAEKVSYMQVVYLILTGSLPTPEQDKQWNETINRHNKIPEDVKRIIKGFPYAAHPMGMLMSLVAALSTFYPEATKVDDAEVRRLQIYRLIAKIPTLAAFIHRHKSGLPFIDPVPELSYSGNFLRMMFKRPDVDFEVNATLEKAMDVLFILHADHEQNCSTSAMRAVGSARPDPYTAAASAIGALAGPLHGGANEAVLRMLEQIGSKDRVAEHIEKVKRGEGRLMGFGHRIYKNYDPRARIIKKMADQVFQVTGSNPLLDIALELEKIALQDEYFVNRKLYPNVDFYSGLIYQAMGFPPTMFPVLFALARTSGWLAQWEEGVTDPEQKIARPRQIYEGPNQRDLEEVTQPGK
jgi:citrate synthase